MDELRNLMINRVYPRFSTAVYVTHWLRFPPQIRAGGPRVPGGRAPAGPPGVLTLVSNVNAFRSYHVVAVKLNLILKITRRIEGDNFK